MNFLEIVKMACRETRIADPSGVISVVDQTGIIGDIVAWCADAWDDLQLERPRWYWMIRELAATALTASVSRYAAAASFGISSFGNWIPDYEDADGNTVYNVTMYRQDQGAAYEAPLPYMAWDAFNRTYRRGTVTANAPQHWSVDPATNEMLVGPAPDSTYTYMLKVRYVKGQQDRLEEDADEPELPTRHHKLIAYLGLQRCAEKDTLPAEVVAAADKYVKRAKVALDREQNGGYTVGGDPIG